MASPSSNELRALADSMFSKERADLVITRRKDSSGQPVHTRTAEVALAHEHEDYRLVPAATLRRAADAIDATVQSHRELMELLVEFQRAVPQDQWPASLRRAKHALDHAHTRR